MCRLFQKEVGYKMMMNNQIKKCTICQGFGWWPFGMMASLGEWDSKEWPYDKIVQCPECGAGGDNKSQRFKELKKLYDNRKK